MVDIDRRMPSLHGHDKGIFNKDLAGRIWSTSDGFVNGSCLKLEEMIVKMSVWKREAISESFDSQGRR